jgi:Uma2 family endonuclease
MATLTSATHVPLEVYLETSYRPDRDWIDGELKERNMGELPHGSVQGFLVQHLRNHAEQWNVIVVPEQRVQTSEKHYRVADVCVLRLHDTFEPIVHNPPLLCVEILSRDDRMSEIQERVDDYFSMGVEAVWVIDPRRRRAFSASAGGSLQAEALRLTVPGTPVTVAVADLFTELVRIGL